MFSLHEVKLDQVSGDIGLFFKSSFSELAGRRGLDNWPTKEQLDQLCWRAAGLFVYATAAVKFIDNNKRGPRNQLDLLLKSQKIGAREGKPLDSLYLSILQEGFGDDDPEEDAKTRSVLGAVIFAANPLSPSAIATLLGLDAEDVLPLLSSFNSLLILKQDDVNCPVRSFHKSFPDFITDQTRCTNPRFHISPPDHHSKLLIGCFGIINQALKNTRKRPDAVTNLDVGDLKERTETYIDPALQYACTSWCTHVAGLVDVGAMATHAPMGATRSSITTSDVSAIRDKMKILCSRVTALVKLFGRPSSSDKETRLREALLTYANNLRSDSMLNSF